VAGRLIKEVEGFEQREKLSKRAREDLAVSLTYLRNHKHQMNYARYRDKGWAIGSGVTETDCKTRVKQRLYASGMRWKENREDSLCHAHSRQRIQGEADRRLKSVPTTKMHKRR